MKKLMRKICMVVLLFPYAKSYSEEYFCEYEWELAGINHCYLYFPIDLPWDQAEKHCTSYGAHLGATHSDSEQYELEQLSWSLESTKDTWLGGYFDNDTSYQQWRWSDKTTIVYFHNDSNWESWNTEMYPAECLAMLADSGYWINRNCTVELPFVCAKDADYDLVVVSWLAWWAILAYCLVAAGVLALVGIGVCICMGTAGCCIGTTGCCMTCCFISDGKPWNLFHGACGCCCCNKKNNQTEPTEAPPPYQNYKI